jgi:DNA-directed RNA polymerase subunit beta'
MLMAYRNGLWPSCQGKGKKVCRQRRQKRKLIESTVGSFIFNEKIPQDIGYVDREVDKYSMEVDFL